MVVGDAPRLSGIAPEACSSVFKYLRFNVVVDGVWGSDMPEVFQILHCNHAPGCSNTCAVTWGLTVIGGRTGPGVCKDGVENPREAVQIKEMYRGV